MQRRGLVTPGALSLTYNAGSVDEVNCLIAQLAAAGGHVLRTGDASLHGGFRGYVADPDDHAWEIAWNPAWSIDDRGHVTFGV